MNKQIKIEAKKLVKDAKLQAANMNKEEKRQTIKLAKLAAREMIASSKLEEVVTAKEYSQDEQIEDIKNQALKKAKELCDNDIAEGKPNRGMFHYTLLGWRLRFNRLKNKIKEKIAKMLGVDIDGLKEQIKMVKYDEIVKNFKLFKHCDGTMSGMSDINMRISEHLYTYKELFMSWYNGEYSFSLFVRVLIAKLTNLSSDIISTLIKAAKTKKEDETINTTVVEKEENVEPQETQTEEENLNKGFNGVSTTLAINR